MSYIKGMETKCSPVDCNYKEPERLVELVSATFKIKATGTEIVITADDIKNNGNNNNYYWDELAGSRDVTDIIINELSKTL